MPSASVPAVRNGRRSLICATCRRWIAPVCAEYLAVEDFRPFRLSISTITTASCTPIRFLIGTGNRRWKICGGVPRSLDVPLRFVAIRDASDVLTVLSSVPVRPGTLPGPCRHWRRPWKSLTSP